MRRVRAIICALLLTAAATAPAQAETVVRWGALSDPETFDPHGPDNSPAWAARRQVYEALTLAGPAQTIEPLLAESWRMLDAHTWEFRLRQGVRFQEGEPLTAEDVVFSLDRYLEEQPYYRAIYGPPGRVEAVDPLTVRITTVRPEPLLYAHLMWPLIASKAWAERHGVGPAEWSGPRTGYADRHADGTGPFILERFEPGVEAVYRKNPAYWGAGRWPLGVDRLVRRPVLGPDAGTDALLAGELDFVDTVPARRASEVEATPRLKVLSTPRLQIFLLGFDQASAELRSSRVKGRNPFADRRVRQAVYEAIDIGPVIAAYGGRGTPAGYLVPRGVAGWSEELDRRLPYDPAEARRLLAEAGYPEGFDVALDCYELRKAMCEVIRRMLGGVGVDVRVEPAPVGEVVRKVQTRRSDFWLHGSGTNLDQADMLLNLYKSSGLENGTGFSDPGLDALLERIQGEFVSYARDAMTEEAWRRVLPEVVYVPLFQLPVVWGMREGLDMPIDNQNQPDFRWAQVK